MEAIVLYANVSPARIIFPASQFNGESAAGSDSNEITARQDACIIFKSHYENSTIYTPFKNHHYLLLKSTLETILVLKYPNKYYHPRNIG
jgi:hypothetical protein